MNPGPSRPEWRVGEMLEAVLKNPLFYSMAMEIMDLPYKERRALASLCDTEGYGSISAVMRWCACSEEDAKSLLLSLYVKGYIVEDAEEKLRQPQMILAEANACVAPVSGKYRVRPGNISHPRRRAILKRDGHTCTYCGASGDGVKLTVDHIVPKSKGGLSTDDNLTTACSPCNLRKGDSGKEEFMAELLAEPTREQEEESLSEDRA